MTIDEAIKGLAGPAGAMIALVLAIITLYLGAWVPGPQFRDMERRALRAENRADRMLFAALRAQGASQALLETVRDRVDQSDELESDELRGLR